MSAIEFTEEDLCAAMARVYAVPVVEHSAALHLVARVAARYGVEPDRLLSRAHLPELVQGRREVYLELASRGWSDSQIGRFVGRDHSTVTNARVGRRRPQ